MKKLIIIAVLLLGGCSYSLPKDFKSCEGSVVHRTGWTMWTMVYSMDKVARVKGMWDCVDNKLVYHTKDTKR